MQTQGEPQKEKLQWDSIQDKDEDSQPQQAQQHRQFNATNKPKPKMQSRGEIDRLIDDCPDEEILLNIVKCHFEATVEEVKTTFPNFDFLKVENYNPGSFSLLFKSKEQAKEFLFTTKETKIRDRGFWIKFPPRFQKSSQKIPENINRENPVEKTGSKFVDAPPRSKDFYNRKQPDQEGQQKQFNRFDEQQGQQHQKPYKKPYKKEEDEGWETVLPHHMPKQHRPYQQQQQKPYYNNNAKKY